MKIIIENVPSDFPGKVRHSDDGRETISVLQHCADGTDLEFELSKEQLTALRDAGEDTGDGGTPDMWPVPVPSVLRPHAKDGHHWLTQPVVRAMKEAAGL